MNHFNYDMTLFARSVDKATNNLRKFSGDMNDTLNGYCSITGNIILDEFQCNRFVNDPQASGNEVQAQNLLNLSNLTIPGIKNKNPPTSNYMLIGAIMRQIKKANTDRNYSDIRPPVSNRMFKQDAHEQYNEFRAVQHLKKMSHDDLVKLYNYYMLLL